MRRLRPHCWWWWWLPLLPAAVCQRTPPCSAFAPTTTCPQAARERLLAPGGRLTDEERQRIQEKLMALPLNGGGTTGNLSAVAAAE